MDSKKNLELILDEMNFSAKEKDGFKEAISKAQAYMRDGDVDLENEFRSIVERVVNDEVQSN